MTPEEWREQATPMEWDPSLMQHPGHQRWGGTGPGPVYSLSYLPDGTVLEWRDGMAIRWPAEEDQ